MVEICYSDKILIGNKFVIMKYVMLGKNWVVDEYFDKKLFNIW